RAQAREIRLTLLSEVQEDPARNQIETRFKAVDVDFRGDHGPSLLRDRRMNGGTVPAPKLPFAIPTPAGSGNLHDRTIIHGSRSGQSRVPLDLLDRGLVRLESFLHRSG